MGVQFPQSSRPAPQRPSARACAAVGRSVVVDFPHAGHDLVAHRPSDERLLRMLADPADPLRELAGAPARWIRTRGHRQSRPGQDPARSRPDEPGKGRQQRRLPDPLAPVTAVTWPAARARLSGASRSGTPMA